MLLFVFFFLLHAQYFLSDMVNAHSGRISEEKIIAHHQHDDISIKRFNRMDQINSIQFHSITFMLLSTRYSDEHIKYTK